MRLDRCAAGRLLRRVVGSRTGVGQRLQSAATAIWLCRFVAAGPGVAVVPQLALPIARADIAVRPLDVEGDLLTRRVGVVKPAGLYRLPAVAAMVAILEGICRGLRHDATARLSSARC